MVDYFDQEDSGWWFSGKETAFRTNAAGKDTTNANNYVYFPFPIRNVKYAMVFLSKNKIVRQLAGVGPDLGEILHGGYDYGKLQLSGDLVDFSLLYFLCKACTTTDAAPQYTHVYQNTTARSSAATFQIFNKHTNLTGAQSVLNLLVGCIVTRITVSGSQNQTLKCTIYIEFANIVAGTALTAPGYPTYRAVRVLTFEDATITFSKGGTDYDGKCTSWEWDYNDGATLHKCAGESKPDEALLLPRTNTIKIDWLPKTKGIFTDMFTDEPTEADDVDIILKISRNVTTEYIQCSWTKVFPIVAPKEIGYTYNNVKLLLSGITYAAKPTWQEASAGFIITEENTLNKGRYET